MCYFFVVSVISFFSKIKSTDIPFSAVRKQNHNGQFSLHVGFRYALPITVNLRKFLLVGVNQRQIRVWYLSGFQPRSRPYGECQQAFGPLIWRMLR